MDNREGMQPDSIKPGHPPGNPSDAMREGAPPPPDVATLDTDEPEPGFFTPTNIVVVGSLIALAIFLFSKFNLEELWNIAKAGLGLSFVIFIHELGHFLAAKWCGVNVTTFSIGFPPHIPGAWFKWGETSYKLGILPLGGYVQMVGQVDVDEAADDQDDPRSYRKKSVAQRMLIISAGVIMNAILAIICFIAVYQGPGREHPAGVIDRMDSNGPVWKKGAQTGAVILKLGDIEDPNFTDLKYTVIFSTSGQKIPLEYQVPGKEKATIIIESRKDKGEELRAIGVSSPLKLEFASKRGAPEGPFIPGTPAAVAGFEFGDVIIAMTDPADTKRITDLPADPRFSESGQRDYFEFTRRLQQLADQEIVLRVQRGKKDATKVVDIKVAPSYRIDLGIVMKMGRIQSVRDGADAEGKVRGPIRDPESNAIKFAGDLITKVVVTDADDKVLEYVMPSEEQMEQKIDLARVLDPCRLPLQLRQWSERLDKAGVKDDDEKRTVNLHLERHSDKPAQPEKQTAKIKWDKSRRFDRVVPLSLAAPMAIPELGFAYEIRSVVVAVTGADSPFQKGDVLKNMRIDVEGYTKEEKGPWATTDIEEEQWAFYSGSFTRASRKINKLFVKVQRSDKGEKKIGELEIPVLLDKTWPQEERGWLLAADTRRVKADNSIEAVQMGLTDTHRRMMEVFFTLRGIVRGDISPKVIGGPITIAVGTYRFAGMDFAEFVFFLGLISINLAVVNFLPIPVLDGGHMVFLLYEKFRGKPMSEAVRVWSTYAGLAVILALMVFVLYQDVTRFFF